MFVVLMMLLLLAKSMQTCTQVVNGGSVGQHSITPLCSFDKHDHYSVDQHTLQLLNAPQRQQHDNTSSDKGAVRSRGSVPQGRGNQGVLLNRTHDEKSQMTSQHQPTTQRRTLKTKTTTNVTKVPSEDSLRQKLLCNMEGNMLLREELMHMMRC